MKTSKTHVSIIAGLTAVALILIIGGFFTPPMGQIDGSVLTACGIIFAFSALWTAILSLFRGADVTIKHGKTDVTINNDKE